MVLENINMKMAIILRECILKMKKEDMEATISVKVEY